jgi:hypothetical protein
LDALIGALDEKIIEPARIRFAELLVRKAEKMHRWFREGWRGAQPRI